jgi:hypothetical protein
MKIRQLGAFLILLTATFGVATAWSGQNSTPVSASGTQVNPPQPAAAGSAGHTGPAKKALPSIIEEEEIPAFLRMDPCDTGNA